MAQDAVKNQLKNGTEDDKDASVWIVHLKGLHNDEIKDTDRCPKSRLIKVIVLLVLLVFVLCIIIVVGCFYLTSARILNTTLTMPSWQYVDEWGTCYGTCGSGIQNRTQTCVNADNTTTSGGCSGFAQTQTQACNEHHCPQKLQKSTVTMLKTDQSGLNWTLKHTIESVGELHFMASDLLAICSGDHVKVYQVNREETHLLYSLTSEEWGGAAGVWPCDVAVSDSLPESILMVVQYNRYVYQFSRNESSWPWSWQYVNKYPTGNQIYNGEKNPSCIAANANIAVVGIYSTCNALVIFTLPAFTLQTIVRSRFIPLDLSITADYLLVMGYVEMVVKALDNIDQELCTIQPPPGSIFRSVAFRNDAREIYAVCYHANDKKSVVYKYMWDGRNTPQYVNKGRVIDNLNKMRYRGLSVTSDGLLAVSELDTSVSKIFSLE